MRGRESGTSEKEGGGASTEGGEVAWVGEDNQIETEQKKKQKWRETNKRRED